MKKVWLGAVVVFVGILSWQIPQYIESQRKAREVLEEQQIKADAAKAAEAAQRAAEEKKRQDEKRAAVAQASDESLKSLIRDCRKKISDKIAKPSFAVHFPDYDAIDLRNLSAMGSAMNMKTGRPSLILDRDDHELRQIALLRRIPYQISVVAESASDSFSGVKRRAAAYSCSLDGFSITSVSQDGPLHFF